MTTIAQQFGMTEAMEQLGISAINAGTSTGTNHFSNGDILNSFSPVDGNLIAGVQTTTAADYQKVMDAATAAFKTFRLMPAPQRGEIVRQFGDKLRKNKEALGKLMGRGWFGGTATALAKCSGSSSEIASLARSRGDSVRDDVSAPPRVRGGFSGEGPRTAHRCADPRSGGASRTKSALATRSSRREALRSSHAIERRTRTPAEAPDEGSDEGIERERRSARST